MNTKDLMICLLFLAALSSCKKDELPYYFFESPYDEHSGIEIFTLDTIYLSFDHHVAYLFFQDDSMLLHAISAADSLVVYRNGALYSEQLPNDHYADVGVSLHTTYNYNFAFLDSTGALTKISQPFEVDIP